MTKKTKTTQLVVRVTEQTRERFARKAQQYGGTGAVLRELAVAFIEDRVVIERNPNRKSIERLYDDEH